MLCAHLSKAKAGQAMVSWPLREGPSLPVLPPPCPVLLARAPRSPCNPTSYLSQPPATCEPNPVRAARPHREQCMKLSPPSPLSNKRANLLGSKAEQATGGRLLFLLLFLLFFLNLLSSHLPISTSQKHRRQQQQAGNRRQFR